MMEIGLTRANKFVFIVSDHHGGWNIFIHFAIGGLAKNRGIALKLFVHNIDLLDNSYFASHTQRKL